VREFEIAMARYLGVSGCIATNSCTAAMHLALMECGVGSGHELIIPALTFVATRNVIEYVGAKPIISDVDLETWCITDKTIPRKGKIPKGIISVDLFGNPVGINKEFIKLAFSNLFGNQFFLISDSAESLGTKDPYDESVDYLCYSFNGNKTMTTGGGGLLIGENLNYIREKINPGHYNGIGYNYRMTGLSAALGLAQLKRLPEFLKKKRRFNEIYRNELDELVTFQKATPDSNPSWWFTACLFPEHIHIAELQNKLLEHHIPTRRIFKPLADLPNANYIYKHGLCLPSSTLNTEEDIYQICKVIKQLIEE